jgi:hypothetical protein
VQREPENIDESRGPSTAWRLVRSVVRPRQASPGPAAVLRWLGQLALLDSWSPDSDRRRYLPGAWRDVLVEWTGSGDLTKAQAAALLALDESTSWEA